MRSVSVVLFIRSERRPMRSSMLLKNMDFSGGGAVVMAPPAVFSGVVAADVTTLADAGMVTVGVAGFDDAGMAFPADLAGVVAADVTTLADAGMVTVGVSDLADAGMALPADLAGVVTVGVAPLADVRRCLRVNTSRDYRALLVLVDPGWLFRCLVFRRMCQIYGISITWTHGSLH